MNKDKDQSLKSEKEKTNRKWTSNKKYRDNFDKIFKRRQNEKDSNGC